MLKKFWRELKPRDMREKSNEVIAGYVGCAIGVSICIIVSIPI